jgi:ribosome-binding factor A
MAPERRERVAALLQSAIAEMLLRDVKDPRVGTVTVTGVDLSPDLKHARVYVAPFGDAAGGKRALAGLESARRYLQSKVGRRLGLRYTPELRFELDTSFDEAQRMERLLREVAPTKPEEGDDEE